MIKGMVVTAKLPVGIQSFSNLRRENYLYVDKTELIYRLISSGKAFFLSRPRRFGKSLLVSTLQAIFSGDKDLFLGLYIADKIDWSKNYPIIKIDWSSITHTSAEVMEQSLTGFFSRVAADYKLELTGKYAADAFEELAGLLHRKTGNQVVVLIDEYDMPILDSLTKSLNVTDDIRNFLQSFYKVIKAADEHLRFVFLTGVSKFSKISIFSGLNNLRDITLSNEFAVICGYTQEELEQYFSKNIEYLATLEHTDKQDILDRIQNWYNGFSWDGINSVYNPFSTLLLFTENTMRNYWFETGTPTFLIEQIKERNDVNLLLAQCYMQDAEYNSFDYRTLDTKTLMFQTGYLTIKGVQKDTFGDELVYTLGVPNNEVRMSMLQYLTGSFAYYPVENTATMRSRMLKQIFDGDVSAFEVSMREMFAHIPYQLHIPREAYYHSLLLLWLNLLGFDVEAEVSTNTGRLDAVWKWKDRVVITEIKFCAGGKTDLLLEAALEQIHRRRYFDHYVGSKHRVALLAIAFTGKEMACKMIEL